MARTVLFRPEAVAEVIETRTWYANRATNLGDRFIEELESVVARVVERPAAFPRVLGETRRAVLRRYPDAAHFRDTPDQVVVLAVHGRQDPQRWQSRS